MKTIGITQIDPLFTLGDNTLKRDLIYFDEIMYTLSDGLEKFCSSIPEWSDAYKLKLRELEKLEEAGLIRKYTEEELEQEALDVKLLENVLNYKEQARSLSKGFTTKKKDVNQIISDYVQRFGEVGQLDVRVDSLILNDSNENNFIPIIRNKYYNFPVSDVYSSHTVASVIIKKFPKISNDVPLTRFIEFKKDPDTIEKLARLRDWNLEFSKKNYTEKETEQKIDYLLSEYRNQIKIHELKYTMSQMETIVTTTAEILENIVKLNFSNVARTIFEVGKRKINLLEEEQKFTGRELALIYKLEKNSL